MWMPAQTTVPPLASDAQRGRDELSRRREDDRRVELLGRGAVRVAGPFGAELECERSGLVVSGACECEDPSALVERDLADDVRRGSEAVQAESLGVAGHSQRPVADQARAEERSGLEIRIAVGNRRAEALVGDGELRVAAVQRVTREARVVAEVLAAGSAVTAVAVGPPEPGDADAVALREALGPLAGLLHRPDDLVTEDERELRIGQLPVDDVQVGAADAAGVHGDEDLTGARLGVGVVGLAQRFPRGVEDERTHVTEIAAQSPSCSDWMRVRATATEEPRR